MSGCEVPSLANGSVILFPSIPIGLGTNKNWILLHAASFTRDCWQTHTNLEFIQKLSRDEQGIHTLVPHWRKTSEVDRHVVEE